jgi:hypothetical protein
LHALVPAPSDDGFYNDTLREALRAALAGKTAELERLLCLLGAVVTTRPNLKLAAAFGAEMAACGGAAAALLTRLAGDDAAPDTDRAFLPIAAAHGWAGRIRAGRDVTMAWAALAELAADERAPVRLGTVGALISLGARAGGADELVARARSWLDDEDRERRFGAAAVVVETLSEGRVLSEVREPEALLEYMGAVIAEVARASRSAERSDARRRLLASLPRTLAAVVASTGRGDQARRWFEAACVAAVHPDLREVLSRTVVTLRAPSYGQNSTVIDELRRSLASSAKPLRDPSRLRPGTGRGKASRRTR